MKIITCLILALAAVAASVAAEKKALTNADIMKMVKAELPESTIVLSIQNTPSDFDCSTDALIELKGAGVSEKIIDAMLTPKPTPAPAPAPAPAVVAGPVPAVPNMAGGLASLWGTKQTRIDADRVFLISGDQRTELKFTKPGTRTKMFYGMQKFAVLGGVKARLRTAERTPVFEMILPNNVEISSVLALALLGVRSNGTREILIGGGFIAMSQGIPHERNVTLDYEKAADQSQAPEGYEIYRIKPAAPMEAGEYALMVSKPGGGDMGGFGGASFNYNFYELGVD